MNRKDYQALTFFLSRSILFISPIVLFFLFPILVFYFSGEFVALNDVIQNQRSNNRPYFLGLAYTNPDKYYKINSFLYQGAKVLALGSSRVMQFRSAEFKPGCFFNAGGAVSQISHFNKFLENVPIGREPEIIIVGLDQYFFNTNFKDNSGPVESIYEYNVNWCDPSLYLKVYEDYLKNKFAFEHLRENDSNTIRAGLQARVSESGFRNDGSYFYGRLQESEEVRFKESFERMSKGVHRFEYADSVSQVSLNEFQKLLINCKNRNIKVVAFIPPYAKAVYNKMLEMGKYEYLLQLYPSLKAITDEFNCSLFDFTDIESFGSSDKEAIDGFHGSEKTYLRMLIHMAEKDSALNAFVNEISYLKLRLNECKDNYYVFKHEEL